MHSYHHCSGPDTAEWIDYNTLMVDLLNVGAAEYAAREGCHMWKPFVECVCRMHTVNLELSLIIGKLPKLPD